MKLHLTLFVILISVALRGLADDRPVIAVWPKGKVPGEPQGPDRATILKQRGPDTAERIHFVDTPTLTLYRAPTDAANGCGVVICPGGGYNILAWPKEGLEIAEWFNSIGVTAAVLKYRVPRRDPDEPHKAPLPDAQRALRLMRAHAKDWGIANKRIGILGFSAGGNLTVMAGTQWHRSSYRRLDEIDDLSCRPDFMIPIYAAYLGDKSDDTVLSPKLNITKQTPPTFLAVTQDDKNRGIHAALLFVALKKAGVTAEVHVYSKGGHGYGIRPSKNAVSTWHRRCEDWMRVAGLIPAPLAIGE